MKGTIDQLSPGEREVLAHFFDTPAYTILKKLLEVERFNTATKLVDISPLDTVSIARHQGRADFAKQLHLALKDNYRLQVGLEKKPGKSKTKPKKKS